MAESIMICAGEFVSRLGTESYSHANWKELEELVPVPDIYIGTRRDSFDSTLTVPHTAELTDTG